MHWKWPATDPQHPQSAQERPPRHSLNIYTVTNSKAHDYAAKYMQLGEAGIFAFFRFVHKIRAEQSEWEVAAESAIVNDRLTGKDPNNEARGWYLLDSNAGLWILISKSWPSSTQAAPPRISGQLPMRDIAV
jgi:hypothetical protein